ncbi:MULTISPECIES: hypothetical protein [Chitinophaga]|uniref:Uncharacterized protein n=1 Tax=Chitinophaga chungangae TaxID=2821488 RepID=A0ABS3YAD2_9BACT|nr:hypothetical protein [Chitinophaga chungangae]MBO9151298.1 hypothetical protein [Chitinophaga chungangae]
MICVIMLTIQLVSLSVPVVAAHRQLADGGWQSLAEKHRAPVHMEEDEPVHEIAKTPKHRRKSRLYISGASRQYSFENYAIFRLPQNPTLSIFIPENKTGEYRFQHAFLPAYYSFLFRLTPF